MRNCARWGGWSREAGLDSLAGGAFKAGMGLTVGIPVSIVFGVSRTGWTESTELAAFSVEIAGINEYCATIHRFVPGKQSGGPKRAPAARQRASHQNDANNTNRPDRTQSRNSPAERLLERFSAETMHGPEGRECNRFHERCLPYIIPDVLPPPGAAFLPRPPPPVPPPLEARCVRQVSPAMRTSLDHARGA